MSDQPKFLSVKQFALECGLSVKTIQRRLEDKSIPFRQPGGRGTRILIPADALSALPPHEPSGRGICHLAPAAWRNCKIEQRSASRTEAPLEAEVIRGLTKE